MIAVYQDPPLLFLTTTGSFAPTGRNARVQARTVGARLKNPASAVGGTFGSFSLESKPGNVPPDETRPRKRQRAEPFGCEAVGQRHLGASKVSNASSMGSFRILSACFDRNQALPPSVNLDDVLRVATFHIRRRAAQLVHSRPDRILDALRCRQWCSGSLPLACMGRSPYLDSAIVCVVSKVKEVVSGACSRTTMLQAYAHALHQLREAVLQPALHDTLDIFAATQLLAIYEMLDFPNNGSWMQHVAGASAMAKITGSKALQKAFSAGHVVPMFVESLVDGDDTFFDGEHWRSLLHLCVTKQYPSSEAHFETVTCLTAMRGVFSEAFAEMRGRADENMEMNWPTRLSLLCRAHDVRGKLKALILTSDIRFVEGRKSAKSCDLLGMFLVSVMMLDKLIMTLRKGHAGHGHELERETQQLCTQMLRIELDASDLDPGKDLLLAFRRQTSYPALTYYV